MLRLHVPTSKASFRAKLVASDIFWVVAAPIIALALRNPDLLDPGSFPQEIPATYLYVAVAILCAIPALLLFRVSDGLSHLFSVQDALAVCAAVAAAVASSSLILFVFTRLEGIPRSTPLIYGLVLGAGLTFDRAVARVFHRKAWKERVSLVPATGPQNLRRIIIIGADRFAALTIKLLDHQRPRTIQPIAVLDARPAFIGRSVCGVKIVALLQDLQKVLEEYNVHGVDIDEIWLSDDAPEISEEAIGKITEYCGECGIKFVRISEALNLVRSSSVESRPWTADTRPPTDVGDYFKLKRAIDIIAAMALFIVLMPLTLVAAYLALLDVGAPVIFWQQRVGRNGRKFLLYKFRTYHSPFDKRGARIPEEQRLSKIGRMIRAARLDEIPQLLNVLVGDMSLIGPRPLLPHDQPTDPRVRLLVRPGITGWAQLNGGTIVTPKEKDALDVWYIRHASFSLDLKIAMNTLLFAFTGEKMNRSVVEQALRWREEYQDAFGAANIVDAPSPRQAELMEISSS
jgi:lipopolysaccharide/colanic/teichoic acid biosynthesis glycosyltransferase